MVILGIDPGATGAICAMSVSDDLKVIDVMDMPCVDKELDATVFMDFLVSWAPDHVFMEKAQAMPHQKGMFTYGRLFGEIIGVLKAKLMPYTLVIPQRWKKGELKDMPSGKESSVIRVNQLYPGLKLRKTQHGRSDAILIARYGAKL